MKTKGVSDELVKVWPVCGVSGEGERGRQAAGRTRLMVLVGDLMAKR